MFEMSAKFIRTILFQIKNSKIPKESVLRLCEADEEGPLLTQGIGYYQGTDANDRGFPTEVREKYLEEEKPEPDFDWESREFLVKILLTATKLTT